MGRLSSILTTPLPACISLPCALNSPLNSVETPEHLQDWIVSATWSGSITKSHPKWLHSSEPKRGSQEEAPSNLACQQNVARGTRSRHHAGRGSSELSETYCGSWPWETTAMIWGLQNSHTLNPKHLLPFCLNTSMPHRKLSPYAPIPLNPQKPQAVFWTGLIARETPELFVTCQGTPKESCHHLCCRV